MSERDPQAGAGSGGQRPGGSDPHRQHQGREGRQAGGRLLGQLAHPGAGADSPECP
jgi:hypothetical protein